MLYSRAFLLLPEHPVNDFRVLNILDLFDFFQRVWALDLSFISHRASSRYDPPLPFSLSHHFTSPVFRLLC